MVGSLLRPVAAWVVSTLLLTAGLVGLVSAPASAAAPVVTGTETDLGVQIPGKVGSIRSEQSAQGVLADGRYLAYFANSGGPGVAARFFAMDLAGSTVAQVTVPEGTEILTLTYSSARRTALVAANGPSTGYLYEWDGTALTKLATIAGHKIMRIAAAEDGSVYIGTFAASNGRLFRLAGSTLTDLGQPFPGESYVRSIVLDATTVWVSNYQDKAAKLVRVSRATNARTTVTVPAAFAAQWGAMDMSLAGGYLFLRTVTSPYLFAYDVANSRFATFDDQVARVSSTPETPNTVPYIDGISPYGVSGLIEGRYVYFQRSGAGIMRIDLQKNLKTVRVDRWNGTDNQIRWSGASVAGPVSYAWLPDVAGRSGYSLVTTTIEGKLVVNTPAQSSPVTYVLEAHDSPSTIISLGTDESGRVYSGGFDLPAGVGVHDSRTKAQTVLTAPQVEGFGRTGTAVVMGGYTGSSTASGPLYTYDGSGQPALRTHLNNSQERPVAFTSVGSKVAVGSVPIKNTLGGALSIWDPATNALTVRRNIVQDHSVVSLRTFGDLVVGGTSNVGGTGATPTATSGRVFTYAPATGVLKTLTPPRATSATYSWVGAITPDPAKPDHFWAISTGFLVQFRVAADGTLTLTKDLGGFPNTSSPTGKELGIAFVDGTLFATVDQGVSAINTVTGERTVIAPRTSAGPVVGLVRGADGALYYARGARLYRYDVTSATTTSELAAPAVTSHDLTVPQRPGTFVFSGTGTKNSTVTVSDGSRSRSALVRDDGTWTLGGIDFSYGTHTLTFTAKLAGLTTRTTTVTLTVAALLGSADAPCVLQRPEPTNLAIGGYNAADRDYAFEGVGTPGATVTMVSGTRTRSAVVREDGTWSMNKVWFGWWAGTIPFTASMTGCPSVTNEVPATFATDPGYHVPAVLLSHTSTTYQPGGAVQFKGKGTPGAVIRLGVGNQWRYAAVSSTGRWQMRAVTVSEAPSTFTFTSTVPGYDERTLTQDLYFGTAPTALVSPVVEGPASIVTTPATVTFSGKATAGSKVSVVVDGATYASFVRSSGRWDIPGVPVAGEGVRELTFTSSAPGLTPTSVTKPFTFVTS